MDKAFKTVKEFLASLFDISFKEFITDKVIKILYVFAGIFIAITCMIMFIGSFKQGAGHAFLMFFYSIFSFVVLMMLARAFLEIVIVLFRIAENTEILAGRTPRTAPMDDSVVITLDAEPATVVKTPEPEPSVVDAQPETPVKKPSRKRST